LLIKGFVVVSDVSATVVVLVEDVVLSAEIKVSERGVVADSVVLTEKEFKAEVVLATDVDSSEEIKTSGIGMMDDAVKLVEMVFRAGPVLKVELLLRSTIKVLEKGVTAESFDTTMMESAEVTSGDGILTDEALDFTISNFSFSSLDIILKQKLIKNYTDCLNSRQETRIKTSKH
jgi:hypothetical protein